MSWQTKVDKLISEVAERQANSDDGLLGDDGMALLNDLRRRVALLRLLLFNDDSGPLLPDRVAFPDGRTFDFTNHPPKDTPMPMQNIAVEDHGNHVRLVTTIDGWSVLGEGASYYEALASLTEAVREECEAEDEYVYSVTITRKGRDREAEPLDKDEIQTILLEGLKSRGGGKLYDECEVEVTEG